MLQPTSCTFTPSRDPILALKHFVRHDDQVEVLYSDNAPELIKALKILEWRHVLSKEYISKSNAIAERSIRTALEGARTNLHQAGLHHMYRPRAARHWCMMQNVIHLKIRSNITMEVAVR